jgi:hypothetical protein
MEPKIPDGSYCVFAAPVEGSRQGKIVLAQLRSERDPESGKRYTVKRYSSEKSIDEDDTWRHLKITLHPLNPEYSPDRLRRRGRKQRLCGCRICRNTVLKISSKPRP